LGCTPQVVGGRAPAEPGLVAVLEAPD
jgi:hypothetical protein